MLTHHSPACVVLGLALLTGAAGASDLVLSEDFSHIAEGRLPDGWQAAAGHWGVRDGRLRGEPAEGEEEGTLLLGDPGWQNVALEADIRFESAREPTRWCGLIAREADPDAPGVQFTVRQDLSRSNGLELALRKPPPDGGWRVLQTARIRPAPEAGRTHRLRLEVQGPWIRGYVDGQRVMQSPRANEASEAGRVGIRVNGAVILVDRLAVYRPGPADPKELSLMRTTPLVVAHRGFSWIAPENTLVAYRKAMETCADMAECDVYLTSDRVPVLLHDPTLRRTTGVAARIEDVSLEEVRRLDAGSWKSPEYAGEPIPTLQETLELVKGRMRLVIEIKPQGMEQEVIEAIRASGTAPEDVTIFSFRRDVVAKIVQLEPLLPAVWLVGDLPFDEAGRRAVLQDALQARVNAIGLPRVRVDTELLRWARQCGLGVFVWTVNEPEDMQFLINIGVDAIITDRPDVLCELLNRPARSPKPSQ